MGLINYKVMQATVIEGETNLPEKAVPIGVLTDSESGLPAIAFIMKYEDWTEEYPAEALREASVKGTVPPVGPGPDDPGPPGALGPAGLGEKVEEVKNSYAK